MQRVVTIRFLIGGLRKLVGLLHIVSLIAALLITSLATLHAAEIKGVETSQELTILGRYVAVDNVCAWPNLTLLPDGTIAAVIYRHPSHLQGPGDVQCWTSRDGHGLWKFRGTVAAHDKESTRGNVAVGLAHNGDLVVLVSGWTGLPNYRMHRVPPWVCRSSDAGRTWKVGKSAIALPEEISPDDKKRIPVPYGSIVKLTKDKMAAAFYDTSGAVFVLFSEDDGRTWGNASVLTKEYGTETTLLRLRPDQLLAVSRAGKGSDPDWWLRGLRQYVSEDEGRTWIPGDVITVHNEHPGHLLRLKDSRVLLTFGMRNARKVGIRVSADEGRTWEPTRVLTDLPPWENLVFDPPARVSDLGYPSTVQLADGSFVTAWYSIGTEQHTRYHMGTVLWKLK